MYVVKYAMVQSMENNYLEIMKIIIYSEVRW